MLETGAWGIIERWPFASPPEAFAPARLATFLPPLLEGNTPPRPIPVGV